MSEIKDFVHLQLHTEYSIIDSTVSLAPLFEKVVEDKMSCVAITDVMNIYCTVKAYQKARAKGIKLIIGAELWVLNPNINKKIPEKITILCENLSGYKNLIEIISDAYINGVRVDGIPTIDFAKLNPKNCNGLIALIGGKDTLLNQAILLEDSKKIKSMLDNWQDIFNTKEKEGQDDLFLVVQNFKDDKNDSDQILYNSVKLAIDHNLPIVATCAVRFIDKKDFDAHEIRVCVSEGTTLDDPKRNNSYLKDQCLKSAQEIKDDFKDIPAAIDNTCKIAMRCNVELDLWKPSLPNFPVPEGMSEADYLIDISNKGLDARLAKIKDADENIYKDRLKQELDVIIQMGFPGYFLIVADFIAWSKDNDIPVGPGRGSGAGSIVAYSLNITDIDPIPYDLLFERFLNPERVSMPDFDVDFCMDGRDRVIEYVSKKYGSHRVSQIITFGSMAAKAVVRDVGRVLGHPYGMIDRIAKLIPMDLGMTLTQALEDSLELKQRYEQESDIKNLIDYSLQLEGTIRNAGKHAGGVIIASTKLTDFTPIYCEEGGTLSSQFDKDDAEAVGLVKFDFLGLRNLTIIKMAVDNINKGLLPDTKKFNIDNIPLDDAKSFKLLKACKTTAVFQLESRGMKDLIKRLQPDCFEEIIALVALFRPGPLQSGMVDDFIDRKHGRAKVEYPHPMAAELLKPTYGIILYQEQVMLLAQVLANYSLGGADLLRRAMGKKKPEEMAKQRSVFVEGAAKNNIDDKTANYIFDLIDKFSGYGFNKSHSAAYAMVAYQTAYLKAHYPEYFMAAVLSSDMDNTDKMVAFVQDAKDLGISILPPNVHTSDYRFKVVNNSNNKLEVLFGLGAIKGVGESALECLFEARKKINKFKSLADFCKNLDTRKVNKRVLEAFVKSGALDCLGESRAQIFENIADALKFSEQSSTNVKTKQNDLFSSSTGSIQEPDITKANKQVVNWGLKDKLTYEKEVLGLCLSGHFMDVYNKEVKKLRLAPLSAVSKDISSRKPINIKFCGVIGSIRRMRSKKGNWFNILVLDDAKSQTEIMLFDDAMPIEPLKADSVVVIDAQLSWDAHRKRNRVRVQLIQVIEEYRKYNMKNLWLHLKDESAGEYLPKIKELVNKAEPGDVRLGFTYDYDGIRAKLVPDLDNKDAKGIQVKDELLSDLKVLLGEGSVDVLY